MQLKPQYAATGDHNSQDMSLIQRMVAVIADGYAKKMSLIGYRQVMYKGYKRVPDFAYFGKFILRGQCHGRMATVRRPFIAASTAPKVEDVINLDPTSFSFETYCILYWETCIVWSL